MIILRKEERKMNIEKPDRIYVDKKAALKDGATEDQIITGNMTALLKLQSKLLPKRKRIRLNSR